MKMIWGSPPHMRGKARQWPKEQVWFRITPAHAGKSLFGLLSSAESGDHPRTCGEKWYNAAQSWNQMGSPPHMRGKAGRGE